MRLIQETGKESQAPNYAPSPESPLAGWLCIQQVLAAKTEIALCTLNSDNQVIGKIENDNSICQMMQHSAEHAKRCNQDCGTAYREAVAKGGMLTYRCHAGLQCFATEVRRAGKPIVVLGGRA